MKRSFFKVCVASLALGCSGLAIGLSGCSSDDAKNDGGPDVVTNPDTGVTDTGVTDTGVTDTGTDAGPQNAKLILVHGSPQLGGIRVCFAANGALTPLPALPHDPATQPASLGYPGIPPGAGGPFPATGTDITPLTITPYVMNANSIKTHIKGEQGGEKKCSDLLNPDGGTLVENTDYWKLADIPANTLAHGKTYILILEGCDKNANFGSAQATGANCGANWNNSMGNLVVKVYEVDNKVSDMTKMGAQVIHASAVQQALYGGGVIGATAQADAGNVQVISLTPAQYQGAVTPPAAKALTAPGTQGDFFISQFVFSDAGLGPAIPVQFAGVEQLTTGAAPTGMYKANNNFTFVIVGSFGRNADGSQYFQDAGQLPVSIGPGYAFHPLGFSSDPVIPPLN